MLAFSWPCWAGVQVEGCEVSGVSSLRMLVDWRRAELKRVFCVGLVGGGSVCGVGCGRVYHGEGRGSSGDLG